MRILLARGALIAGFLLSWVAPEPAGAAGVASPARAFSVEEEASPRSDRVLVVYHGDDAYGLRTRDHLVRSLEYGKTPHESWNVVADTELPELAPFGAVVLVTDRLDQLGVEEANRIRAYVAEGGGVVFFQPGWHPLLAQIVGRPGLFRPSYRPAEENGPVSLEGHLMPGAEGLTVPAAEYTSLRLGAGRLLGNEDVTVLATADSGRRPVSWIHEYGEGRVLYWNAPVMGETSRRGLIVQSIAAVQKRAIRPLANWGVVYLDDFPSPAPGTDVEPVASEFGHDVAEFYAERWVPDMRDLKHRFGLAYTSALVFSYDGSTSPPYRFDEWLMGTVRGEGDAVFYSPWISRQASRFSEVGLHGFNHQPLTVENWDSDEQMVRALRRARWRWRVDHIGSYPDTYVPPMNVIDSVGVRALERAFPDLRYIAGFHHGEFGRGQAREFGPEPWAASLYALPRNTSGYILTDGMKLSMLSLLHVAGAWGHFLHPDEVFPNAHRTETLRRSGVSIPEEGFRWRGAPEEDGLYYRFADWLSFVRTHYPWLRYMEAGQAARTMKSYQASTFTRSYREDRVIVHSSRPNTYFSVYARPDDELVDLDGGTMVHHGATSVFRYFVVRADRRKVEFRFIDES